MNKTKRDFKTKVINKFRVWNFFYEAMIVLNSDDVTIKEKGTNTNTHK